MNREILFRGKRLDNGAWYYGSYLFLKDAPTFDWTGKRKAPYDDVHFIIDDQDINIAVDPATVGQYTGLNDKNGKKIFEGDIVQLAYETGKDAIREMLEVRWHPTWLKFVLTNDPNEPGYYFDDLGEYEPSDMEVIGNIHDNPELLE